MLIMFEICVLLGKTKLSKGKHKFFIQYIDLLRHIELSKTADILNVDFLATVARHSRV